MGMAASQAMLLQLTSRKNTIGFELTRLSNQKVSLARDMQRISKEYQAALSDKMLKWSNNGGVSYVDLSYQNLMKPSSMNQNKPYLLTDQSDRIVVDSQYQKYAEKISANGNPGNWENVRTEVLSELTGIDAEKIDKANAYQEEVWASEAVINDLIDSEHKFAIPTKKGSLESLLEYSGLTSTGIGNNFSKGENWSEAYDNEATIDLGDANSAKSNLQKILDTIYNGLAPYLDEDCKEALKKGCDNFITVNASFIDGQDEENEKISLESDYTAIGGSYQNYTVRVPQLIDAIFSNVPKTTSDTGNQLYEWTDTKAANYNEKLAAHEQWQKSLDDAKAQYDVAVNANNQLLTADEESLIAFYDAIFSAIAERGWTANEQVNDPDYLNQMLQNGIYTLTTVDRDTEYDNNSGEYIWDNEYRTDIASNFKNVFLVNDCTAREDALVKYEHEKGIINAKETKIDTRMQNLQTEQAAINQMIQGIEQVKNDNIDRTMNTFA